MNTILFDLDGTLLPMEQKVFLKSYLAGLAAAFSHLYSTPLAFSDAVYKSVSDVLANDGSMTNEEQFRISFKKYSGIDPLSYEAEFTHFYQNEFKNSKGIFPPNPKAAESVRMMKSKGYMTVLATNPAFPKVATLERIKWAGLTESDFDYITVYENSSYCKPNPEYYKEILRKIGKEPKDCLMVGNDVLEDMGVSALGIDTFLLDVYLINRENLPTGHLRQGGYDELLAFLHKFPALN